MTEFLKMDVFFVVATLATVVILVLVATTLVYLIRILRTIDSLSQDVTEEAKALREDISEVRVAAHKEGIKIAQLLGIASSAYRRHKKRSGDS